MAVNNLHTDQCEAVHAFPLAHLMVIVFLIVHIRFLVVYSATNIYPPTLHMAHEWFAIHQGTRSTPCWVYLSDTRHHRDAKMQYVVASFACVLICL